MPISKSPFDKQTPGLKTHEWLAVIFFISTIVGLGIITSFPKQSVKVKNSGSLMNKGLEVVIKGAVKYPGVYRLPSKMPMSDVLILAETLPEADLRRFKLNGSVNKSRVINVPFKGRQKDEG